MVSLGGVERLPFAMSRVNLISRFAAAGLLLELAPAPLIRGVDVREIVQLDIARPDRSVRRERFRLWGGAQSNRIEVQGVDAHLGQLVPMIAEPRRAFQVAQGKNVPVPRGARVVRRTGNMVFVEHVTDERKRHFLVGMEEQHLFVAQLPRPVSTVRAAHAALEGDDVRAAERGAFERTLRQGEWFFVWLGARELAEVEAVASKSTAPVQRKVNLAEAARLARWGRPHVAEEVLVLGGRVYARGAVRHPDHATVTLRPWRRALANAEQSAQPAGVLWVD